MTLTDVLLQEAEETYVITEKLFRRVSDGELSWSPGQGKNWMTMGQLLTHCASFGCGKAVQGFVKGDWGWPASPENDEAEIHLPPAATLPTVESVAQALELLATDRRVAMSCIAAAGEDTLLGKSIVAPWGGPPLTLFQQLLHMIAHLAQHKGQLFYYLKLTGKDVDTTDLWG
jgi:DinB superfamily